MGTGKMRHLRVDAEEASVGALTDPGESADLSSPAGTRVGIRGGDLATLARTQALLGGGGAVIGMLSVALPHPGDVNEIGMLSVQASSVTLSIWLWVRAGHVPVWALEWMPFVATVSVSGVVYFSGDATSAYALFYLWVVIYAFYVLSWREAAVQIAFAIANYALVIGLVGGPSGVPANSEIAHFTLIVGTFVATAIPLLYLRGRVEGLGKRLSAAARTELTTGLPNVRARNDALRDAIDAAAPSRAPVSVVVAEVDHFRSIAEQLGQGRGDAILRALANALREEADADEMVACTGASEFSLVLPRTSPEAAYLRADHIVVRVREGLDEEMTPLSASAGIASYPEDGSTAEHVVRLAGRALEAAKQIGGDRAVLYSPALADALAADPGRHAERGAHIAALVGVAEALERRDPRAAGHGVRVGGLAADLALAMGMTEYVAERLRLAGILHEIGSVGADEILAKPTVLDEEDRLALRAMPDAAARILSARELSDIRSWLLALGERPDARGYPRGLRAAEIPREARILAVADAFDAMRLSRPYRPALSEEEALREVRDGAGTQFDADVVNALAAVREQEACPARRRPGVNAGTRWSGP